MLMHLLSVDKFADSLVHLRIALSMVRAVQCREAVRGHRLCGQTAAVIADSTDEHPQTNSRDSTWSPAVSCGPFAALITTLLLTLGEAGQHFPLWV